MQNQIIETVARGLLADFMTTNNIEPVLDSLEVTYSGPHVVIAMAGKHAGTMEYSQLRDRFNSFLEKHNSFSRVQYALYSVAVYNDIYFSIAQ